MKFTFPRYVCLLSFILFFPFYTCSLYLYESSTHDEKRIWIHTCDIDDVISIQSLTYALKKRFADLEIFVSTVTIEGKETAERTLNVDEVKIIPNDDLRTLAYRFNSINPQAIILVKHEVLPSLILLAQLNKTPIYLLGTTYAEQTERLLNTAPYLHIPLFNNFNQIFTQTEFDKEIFQNLGINQPNIFPIGMLHAFGMVTKKKEYLKYFLTDEKNLALKFPHPTLVISCSQKNKIEGYLKLFKNVKHKYPNLKMILTPEFFLTDKKEIISQVKQLKYPFFVWDEKTSELNGKRDRFKAIKPILDSHDIVLKFVPEHLFHLQAIASIYYIDKMITKPTLPILQAAVWKKPTIVGPYRQNKTINKACLILDDAIIPACEEKDLYNITMKFLDNKKALQAKGETAFSWIRQLSNGVNKRLEPLFSNLEQDLHDA